MTTTPADVPDVPDLPGGSDVPADLLSGAARDHLWMHFTRLSAYASAPVPVIVRGEGPYIWDANGRRYLDGLSGLFVVQAGHGRTELAEAAYKQAAELAFFPLWSYAHPKAIELAERLAALAPGDINRVFFTTGGGEAVESAWKVARQYFKLVGQPLRHKVISRSVAYHGTTMGALSITGIPAARQDFEPLVPGAVKVANTNFYRAPEHGDDYAAFGRWAADEIARAIEYEGPETVAAVFLEPVQNSGGCFPPPPGYFAAGPGDLRPVRRAAGLRRGDLRLRPARAPVRRRPVRLPAGHHHLREGDDLRLLPDRRDAGLGPDRGAVPARAARRSCTASPSPGTRSPPRSRWRTSTSCEREDLPGHVLRTEGAFRATLEKLLDLPIVGEVRGDGFFYGIELVKDKADPAHLRRGRVGAAAARLPVPGAVRRRALLPGRRPRRPGGAAGTAADLRPGAVRRDGADPALGADRGLDPHLIHAADWTSSTGRPASAHNCGHDRTESLRVGTRPTCSDAVDRVEHQHGRVVVTRNGHAGGRVLDRST